MRQAAEPARVEAAPRDPFVHFAAPPLLGFVEPQRPAELGEHGPRDGHGAEAGLLGKV